MSFIIPNLWQDICRKKSREVTTVKLIEDTLNKPHSVYNAHIFLAGHNSIRHIFWTVHTNPTMP